MMNEKWHAKLNKIPIKWLLDSNPWTKYKTLTELLNKPESSDEVKNAKNELVNHPKIINLINETSHWFTESITRHDVPTIPYYKLMILAEFGLNKDDKGIKEIFDKIYEHILDNMFGVRETLPKKVFEKSDKDANEWHALPCDTPIITYSMLKMGNQDAQVMHSVKAIKEKWNDSNNWFCDFFFVRSIFKKLNINCPMSGLMALEVFSQIPDLKESIYAANAYETIKFHKDYGKSVYYFGRSKKFWTFKFPFVWYNALYMADVLTKFDFLKGEDVVKELINWIEESQDNDGKFRPTSTFKAYRDWDFSNKKEPSSWITFLCCRILKRYYE